MAFVEDGIIDSAVSLIGIVQCAARSSCFLGNESSTPVRPAISDVSVDGRTFERERAPKRFEHSA